MADDLNKPAFYPRVGNIRPKPRSPLQQTEMRERPLDAAMGALKQVLDKGSELLDRNPATPFDVTRGLVSAIPFIGPNTAKQFEQSNVSIPVGMSLDSRNAGIETVDIPTKDALNAIKWSDLVGTQGASRAAESIGYGETPEFFDALDATAVGAGLYGAAKMAPKVARAAGKGAKAVARPVGQAISDAMIYQSGPLAKGPMSALAPRSAMTNVFEPNPKWKLNTSNIDLPTPGIMIPSKMSNVREAVRNMKGNYGARRVERAADEIPDLERMFQEDTLKEAFTGDNASAMITLNPADFEKYAQALTGRTKADIGPKMAELAKQGEIDKYTVPLDEYIKHLQSLQEGFNEVPYLNLSKDEVGLPTMPSVIGHEGRHRNRALADQGAPSSLVKINPRNDLREGMPRRTQEEFIEALREELERSNRLVLPEKDGSYRRPAVEFPEPYAEGGDVHMNAGGTPRYPTEQEREAMRKLRESFLPAVKDAERLKRLRDNMERSEQKKVSFSDNPDTMMLELNDAKMAKAANDDSVHMAGGGLSKLAKLARASAKSKAEIDAIAQRMAPQMTGEYVRGKEGAKTVAGKTQKQFEREKTIEHDIRPTGAERPLPETVDIESLKGKVMMGIAGDPTITGQTVYGVAGRELKSPAPQHGGPLYGLGREDDAFWASQLGAANKVQNLSGEISRQYDAPVVGNYVMMGPDSYSYAQHFADTNIQNIRPEEMTKAQIEGFNKMMREGYPYVDSQKVKRQRVFPSFPGIENPEEMYLQFAIDPDMRKHFGNLMQMPTVTEKYNMPSGLDVAHAVTEPSLRDLEIGVTGRSLGMMMPEVKDLKLSEHPTYSHDIPGKFIGSTKYPVPYELMFPDTVKAVRENPKQAPQEFGSFKMIGPRQIIDPQMIDEIKQYEEFIKKYTGKKEGGEITVKPKKMAAGGEITAEDLDIEERPL